MVRFTWIGFSLADELMADLDETLPSDPQPPVGVAAGGDVTQSIASDVASSGSGPVHAKRRYPTIEGYQITGVLGHGGMGIVYRAVQTKLNRTVALKVLPAMVGAASKAAVSRFRREATSAARLHHTNIIPVYDFGEATDGYFYAMELIDGQPLDLFVRRLGEQHASTASPVRLGKILETLAPEAIGLKSTVSKSDKSLGFVPPSASGIRPALSDGSSDGSSTVYVPRKTKYFRHVAGWMADVADALNYAHEQNVIHRDIKPANLILSLDGRIMLADFGLAKGEGAESVTMTGTLVGTLRYMSPEQAMAKRVHLDHRTDIYSLGATLYELLCFRPVFLGDDQKTLIGDVLSREPTSPRKIASAVPPELETICLKCLEKSADARYSTGAELAQDLRRFINDLPIAAKRPGPIRRTIKLIRRHKAASVAIAATIFACGAVGVGFHFQRKSEVATAEARLAEIESRKAEAEARASRADEYIAEGQRLQGAPTRTVAATLEKLHSATLQYESALAIRKDYWLALSNLAVVKKDMYNIQVNPDPKLLEDASDFCDRALAVESEDARLWNLKGVLAKKLGRYPQAVLAYQRATELEPNSVYWWDNYGVILALAGDIPAARTALQKATELAGTVEPCNVHAWRNLTALQLMRGDSEAILSLEQAKICDPTDLWLNVLRARIRLQPGEMYDPQRALFRMESAAETSRKGEPRIDRVLALAYLRTGDSSSAIDHARRAIENKGIETTNRFIITLAEADLGDRTLASQSYDAATKSWTPDLRDRDSYVVSAPSGALWIDTAEEIYLLQEEAAALLDFD